MLRNSATLYQTTQRNLPEDMNVYKYCCEELKIQQAEDTSDVRRFNNMQGDLIPRGLLLWLDTSYVIKKETAWTELN